MLLAFFLNGLGQSAFSTYSRFGIGIPTQPGSMTHFGMGGVSTPITDASLINLSNPGTYSFCGITTLQVNAVGGSIKASTNNSAMSYNSGQANEFAMLFKKPGSRWAFAAGLSPYSTVNYSLSNSQPLNDSITARYLYTGEGGLNKMTIGTSRVFTIYKTQLRADSLNKKDTTVRVPVHQFSVGVNANRIFGSLNRINHVEFDNATYYNTKSTTKLQSKGWTVDVGLLYRTRLSKKEENSRIIGESNLYVGIDYKLQSDINTVLSESVSKFIYNSGVAVSAGEIHRAEDVNGKMTLPQYLAVGIAYRKSSKKWGRYTLAADFKTQDWGNYKISFDSPFAQAGYLDRASTFSVGFEFEPTIARNSDFLHRMTYRAGLRNTDTHLKINSTAIKQQGVSVGLSIPVVRSLSRFHMGAEYMTNGTLDNNLVMEKGFNFMVGFTLTPSERWFFQRKYD